MPRDHLVKSDKNHLNMQQNYIFFFLLVLFKKNNLYL